MGRLWRDVGVLVALLFAAALMARVGPFARHPSSPETSPSPSLLQFRIESGRKLFFGRKLLLVVGDPVDKVWQRLGEPSLTMTPSSYEPVDLSMFYSKRRQRLKVDVRASRVVGFSLESDAP